MRTDFILLARYEGRAVVPVEDVCADYFGHLSPEKLIRKIDAGEIDLPLVRIEKSTRCQRGVHINDLARYIDAQTEAARIENDKMHGRKVLRRYDSPSRQPA